MTKMTSSISSTKIEDTKVREQWDKELLKELASKEPMPMHQLKQFVESVLDELSPFKTAPKYTVQQKGSLFLFLRHVEDSGFSILHSSQDYAAFEAHVQKFVDKYLWRKMKAETRKLQDLLVEK
jgi:hypothetical protein